MTYYHQQTRFTCGPASIRNCLLALGYIYSEKRIRNFAGTDKSSGTSERKIIRALRELGFEYKEFYNKSEKAFRQRIIRNAKSGNKMIILTDHEDHWVSIVDYFNRKFEVIDPQRIRNKTHLTPKEVSKWCLNFNRRTRETYYYGIVIFDPGNCRKSF